MAVSDFPPQTFVVASDGKKHKPGVLDPRIRLVNPDGTAYKPSATATAGAAVADATEATLLAQFNALLASLRTAGVIAGS